MTVSFKIETMVFTNPTEHTVKLAALGFDPVPPGKDVELPLEVCAPYRMDNGERGKSPVEQVAPQLRPKDPGEFEVWRKVPEPARAQSKIVTIAKRDPSEAPGVRALREQKAAANAAPKATVSPQPNANASAGKA